MNFLRRIYQSVYSPEFYRELLSRPFSFSFKYYYGLAVLVALVMGVFLTLNMAPAILNFARNILPGFAGYYPEELVITIKDGKASANQPYIIKMPAEFDISSSTPNLLVIDTEHPFMLEVFYSYKTAALLTEDNLISRDKEGRLTITPISRFPNTVINRSLVENWIGKASRFISWLFPLVGVFIFIGYIVYASLLLIYLLIAALLILLIGRIKKAAFGYKKAYQIGLHAITLSFVLEALLGFIPQLNPHIPFQFTLLLLVIVIINISAEGTGTAVQHAP